MLDMRGFVRGWRRAQDAAREHLEHMSGRSPDLHLFPQDLWREREHLAILSAHHGDLENAAAILDRALHVLDYGHRVHLAGEIELDDLRRLMESV